MPFTVFLPPQVSHGAIFVLVQMKSRKRSEFLLTWVVNLEQAREMS